MLANGRLGRRMGLSTASSEASTGLTGLSMWRIHRLLRTTGASSRYETKTEAASSSTEAASSASVRSTVCMPRRGRMTRSRSSQAVGRPATSSSCSSSWGLNRSLLSRRSVCRMLLIMPPSITVP